MIILSHHIENINNERETNEKNQIELRTDPILLQLDGKNILIDSGVPLK